MPSWNEKPVTVPTVNVNIKPCNCMRGCAAVSPLGRPCAGIYAHTGKHYASDIDEQWSQLISGEGARHHESCPKSAPVLIACPIPRSVTFTVRLGECSCRASMLAGAKVQHRDYCPARPIRVSCSISGKTWEESEVMDVDGPVEQTIPIPYVTRLCRERWALVKALVLGLPRTFDTAQWTPTVSPFFEQRDAVYAALSDMALAEDAAFKAQDHIHSAIHDPLPLEPYHNELPEDRPSARMLERYVAHLIEQVGVLQ